jgi:poly(3-hydroxyalkanoate) synthetase
MDEASARKIFYSRQFVDALSPANFVATNLEVLTATLQSGGRNLLQAPHKADIQGAQDPDLEALRQQDAGRA